MKDVNLIILSASIFIAWMIAFVLIYGWKESVSAYYYELPKNFRILIFPLFFASFTIPLMITGNSYLSVSSILLWFVGIFGAYKEKKGLVNEAHYIGAGLSIIIGMIGVWLDCNLGHLALGYLIPLSFLAKFKLKNPTLWIELSAFSIIYSAFIYVSSNI